MYANVAAQNWGWNRNILLREKNNGSEKKNIERRRRRQVNRWRDENTSKTKTDTEMKHTPERKKLHQRCSVLHYASMYRTCIVHTLDPFAYIFTDFPFRFVLRYAPCMFELLVFGLSLCSLPNWNLLNVIKCYLCAVHPQSFFNCVTSSYTVHLLSLHQNNYNSNRSTHKKYTQWKTSPE